MSHTTLLHREPGFSSSVIAPPSFHGAAPPPSPTFRGQDPQQGGQREPVADHSRLAWRPRCPATAPTRPAPPRRCRAGRRRARRRRRRTGGTWRPTSRCAGSTSSGGGAGRAATPSPRASPAAPASSGDSPASIRPAGISQPHVSVVKRCRHSSRTPSWAGSSTTTPDAAAGIRITWCSKRLPLGSSTSTSVRRTHSLSYSDRSPWTVHLMPDGTGEALPGSGAHASGRGGPWTSSSPPLGAPRRGPGLARRALADRADPQGVAGAGRRRRLRRADVAGGVVRARARRRHGRRRRRRVPPGRRAGRRPGRAQPVGQHRAGVRDRGPEGALHPPAAARRRGDVPAVLRAGRRVRPRRPADPRRARRRRVGRQRARRCGRRAPRRPTTGCSSPAPTGTSRSTAASRSSGAR